MMIPLRFIAQRPVKPLKPARRRIPGNARVDDLHILALRRHPCPQDRHETFFFAQAITRSQTVAQRNQLHFFHRLCGRLPNQQTGEKHYRQRLAHHALYPICP